MPKISRNEYTNRELERHDAAYGRLLDIIESAAPDAEEFRRLLNKELATGFPIDWTNYGDTLLHALVFYTAGIRAGLPQILIEAGADVDAQTDDNRTPLGLACSSYISRGAPEYLAVIDVLLAAGARSKLGKSWREGWPEPEHQARRDKLAVYVDTWHERRTIDRMRDAASAFDYAL